MLLLCTVWKARVCHVYYIHFVYLCINRGTMRINRSACLSHCTCVWKKSCEWKNRIWMERLLWTLFPMLKFQNLNHFITFLSPILFIRNRFGGIIKSQVWRELSKYYSLRTVNNDLLTIDEKQENVTIIGYCIIFLFCTACTSCCSNMLVYLATFPLFPVSYAIRSIANCSKAEATTVPAAATLAIKFHTALAQSRAAKIAFRAIA